MARMKVYKSTGLYKRPHKYHTYKSEYGHKAPWTKWLYFVALGWAVHINCGVGKWRA